MTTPQRTTAELGRVARDGEVRKALRQAAFLGLHLGNEDELPRERSHLERLFLRLCRRHNLPLPEVNVSVGPFTADFLWRERRVAVETDGWQSHRGRQAFKDDRARDAYLRLHAYEVLRFSWRQVLEEPAAAVAVLRRYLA